MQSGGPVPRPSYLPFPAWMETKNRLAAHIEDERKSYGEKSREWEEKEQVRQLTQDLTDYSNLFLYQHFNRTR